MGHHLDIGVDEDGWHVAFCSCGWVSMPSPDDDSAQWQHDGHLAEHLEVHAA